MGQGSATTGETPPPTTRLMVFMFTDVADSTKLKQPENLHAGAYADLARKHDALFRQTAASISGADVLKDVGDGFMATFASASDAVRAALRFQFAVLTDPDFTPADCRFPSASASAFTRAKFPFSNSTSTASPSSSVPPPT
jgi:class 3 adenylate cyclase